MHYALTPKARAYAASVLRWARLPGNAGSTQAAYHYQRMGMLLGALAKANRAQYKQAALAYLAAHHA